MKRRTCFPFNLTDAILGGLQRVCDQFSGLAPQLGRFIADLLIVAPTAAVAAVAAAALPLLLLLLLLLLLTAAAAAAAAAVVHFVTVLV